MLYNPSDIARCGMPVLDDIHRVHARWISIRIMLFTVQLRTVCWSVENVIDRDQSQQTVPVFTLCSVHSYPVHVSKC